VLAGALLVIVAAAGAARQADEWTLVISAPSTADAGSQFTVSATVTYTYPTNNANITMVVQLPMAASVVSWSDQAHCSDPSFSKASYCTFPNLSGSATVDFVLTAPDTVASNLPSIATTANGFATPAEPTGASANTLVTASPPAITISAQPSPGQVVPGGTVGFAVTATNTGSAPLANVWISNELGTGWSADSMTQSSGLGFSCSRRDSWDSDCFIASFAAGATATFSASATAAPAAAGVLNSRFVVYLGPSPGGTSYAITVANVPVVPQASTPTTTTTTPTTTTAQTTTSTTATVTAPKLPARQRHSPLAAVLSRP
jgi:hypothetical protein